ncbi:MAG: Flp pilus assembly protein CpaB [Nitrospirota bacterium]|nr:Flp pilus assembly protein CpaB [Nitrospirota bacterium]
MKRTRMVGLGLAALMLSAGITFVAYRMLSNRMSPQEEKMVPVVVAKEDLLLGTLLTELELQVVTWPETMKLEGSFSDLEDLVGRGLIMPVVTNEPILESKLAPKGAGAGLASMIPEGMRAVTVKVNDVIGVAGFVGPGAHVDVILTGSPTTRNETDTSKVILENVQVLAAGQNIEQHANGEPQDVQVVTLLVTPDEAQRLALASQDGRIQLALRNPLDLEHVDPKPTKRAALYRGGSSAPPTPVPQKVVVTGNVNLRRDPSTNQPPTRLLAPPEALVLLAEDQINGFYHVRTTANEDGWVWGQNIRVGPEAKVRRTVQPKRVVAEPPPPLRVELIQGSERENFAFRRSSQK